MKKIIAILCAFFTLLVCFGPFGSSLLFADTTNHVKVLTNVSPVYSSTQSDASVLFVASHKDIFETSSDIKVLGHDGIEFYELLIADYEHAYIKASDVLLNPIQNISNLITPNGHFRKKVSNVTLYSFSSGSYHEYCSLNVTTDTRIRITNGYDKSKEYTQIQILLNDEIQTLYVYTDSIRAEGLSKGLKIFLYIFSTLILGVIVTFITMYIKKLHKTKT